MMYNRRDVPPEERGKYYQSLRSYAAATGRTVDTDKCPSIHISGSMKTMRRLYWGYRCDVVCIGRYYYAVERSEQK